MNELIEMAKLVPEDGADQIEALRMVDAEEAGFWKVSAFVGFDKLGAFYLSENQLPAIATEALRMVEGMTYVIQYARLPVDYVSGLEDFKGW